MSDKKNSDIFWWVVAAAVVSGLIVAAVTTSWLKDVLNLLVTVAVFIWGWLWAITLWLFTAHYSIPAYVIVPLIILSLWKIISLCQTWYESTETYKTSYERYTSDLIFGAVWSWYYFNGISGLKAHCAHDSTPLVCTYDFDDNTNERHWYQCERCNTRTKVITGSQGFYLGSVSREIQGRINRKDYLPLITKSPLR